MFKYIFLMFVLAALINRYIETKRIYSLNMAKGTVSHAWITKSMHIFYILIFAGPILEVFAIDRQVNYILSGVMFVIYVAAMILWYWAIRTLGNFWSVNIEIRDKHTLIKNGPYRYIRHPHYLILLTEVLGIPLIANAYYSFIIVAAIFVPLISLRIIFEEQALVAKFGDQYRQYQKEVWALFPFPLFKKGVN